MRYRHPPRWIASQSSKRLFQRLKQKSNLTSTTFLKCLLQLFSFSHILLTMSYNMLYTFPDGCFPINCIVLFNPVCPILSLKMICCSLEFFPLLLSFLPLKSLYCIDDVLLFPSSQCVCQAFTESLLINALADKLC